MHQFTTKAWVLRKGHGPDPGEATLEEETISLPGITDSEILVEPLYGCWEANMTHALERRPVDICQLRGEERVVLGNAGVVRVLQTGSRVEGLDEGDCCVLVPIGESKPPGYLTKVFGYDARDTVGLLARRTKVCASQLMRIESSRHELRRWAAFSVRYANAWVNWRVAVGCWTQLLDGKEPGSRFVCAWGGGVSLAEVTLARQQGWQAAMVVSCDERAALVEGLGITPIDRREFPDLAFEPERFETDPQFRRRYFAAEWAFIQQIREFTGGAGVSILIDNIGTPVHRASLKALGQQGVITTCGWKCGSTLRINRAVECMNHHVHVYTHGATYEQGQEAMRHAEETGWLAPVDSTTYCWEDIPKLAEAFRGGKLRSYFPIYDVNAE